MSSIERRLEKIEDRVNPGRAMTRAMERNVLSGAALEAKLAEYAPTIEKVATELAERMTPDQIRVVEEVVEMLEKIKR